MPKKLIILALLLAACARSRQDGNADSATDSAVVTSVQAPRPVAFRLPAGGGALRVYDLPSLDTTTWGAGSRLTGARSAVGVDQPGRRLLFLDSVGAIASFDLVSLRQKTVAPRHAWATVGADGALLAVDSSGAVFESQPWGTRTWPDTLGRGVMHVFAAPGPRLIAIRHTRGGDSLALSGRESGIAQSLGVPDANDEAASRDGDAIAFATDSGVVVFEDREFSRPWFVRLAGRPRGVVFSPSGHRLYVALADKSELAVIDRFGRRERSAISLPGAATALRADPWGRTLLIRADSGRGAGDIWVVGIAKNSVIGTLRGAWSSDLPTASQGGVILSREGTAIVARDIHSLDSLSAVAGAGGDVWFAGLWIPTSGAQGLRAALAARDDSKKTEERPRPQTSAVRDSTAYSRPSTVSKPANAGQASFWTQLTSTRSEAAARALAAELRSPDIQVIQPRTEDDTWRVMVGPFWTREAADSAGRSIGRPFWVVDRAREAQPRQ